MSLKAGKPAYALPPPDELPAPPPGLQALGTLEDEGPPLGTQEPVGIQVVEVEID